MFHVCGCVSIPPLQEEQVIMSSLSPNNKKDFVAISIVTTILYHPQLESHSVIFQLQSNSLTEFLKGEEWFCTSLQCSPTFQTRERRVNELTS